MGKIFVKSQIVPTLKEKINLTTLKLRISVHHKYHKESENANLRGKDICKAYTYQRIGIQIIKTLTNQKKKTTQILNGQRELKKYLKVKETHLDNRCIKKMIQVSNWRNLY